MKKWWALLAAKVIALIALHILLVFWINGFFPKERMGRDLSYTFALFGADMLVFVIGYALWADQKYRCRSCLTRLRMPLAIGNWSHVTLFGPAPRLEWICPFGHGTMSEVEARLSGTESDHWQKNDTDFWRAFEDAWRKD